MVIKNPANYFARKDVTDLLVKLTGFDLKKIFRPGFNPSLRNSEIQLLTQKELKQENEKIIEKAKNLLQMPPYLNPREKQESILAKDDRLNFLNSTKTNYIFIDISMNVPDNKRMIVVRESNGVLRKAHFNEREKVIQVYFPKYGKSNYIPEMFYPKQLEESLKLKNYLLILNKACIKFEPNDAEFLRITNRVYEYINEQKDYDILYSTRFYGPMVFYLAWYKKLENLISYMLRNSKLSECVDIINLYLILHEESKSKALLANETSDLEKVKIFLKNDLANSSTVDLELKNFEEKAKKNIQI